MSLWKNIRNWWTNFASYKRFEVGDGSQGIFGRIFGLAMEFSVTSTLSYSNLLEIKRPWFLIIWSGLMVNYIGSQCLLERLKIGRFF